METVLRSASREVVIGPGQPFCIIGERINPTGRKIFQEQLRRGDLSRIEIDVAQQVAGGAMVLDVNMGAPLADEAELMVAAVKLIQGLTDLPLCIDSSIIEVLDAGQGAGELGDRRGRAAGGDPPAGQEVRRRGHRAPQ
jgi:5-methyltetrahydrofolate--homocysteine methyltransferase